MNEKCLIALGFELIANKECFSFINKIDGISDVAERVSNSRDWYVYRGDLIVSELAKPSFNCGFLILGDFVITGKKEFSVDDGFSLVVLGNTKIDYLFLEGESYLLGNTYFNGYLAARLNVHPRYVKHAVGTYIIRDPHAALCVGSSKVDFDINYDDLSFDIIYLIIKNDYIEEYEVDDNEVCYLDVDQDELLSAIRQNKNFLVDDAIYLIDEYDKRKKEANFSSYIKDIEGVKKEFEKNILLAAEKSGLLKFQSDWD
ncbi:hypothetical protein N9J26_01090 [bacterium]|nr:hypothetical protein [bacterium]